MWTSRIFGKKERPLQEINKSNTLTTASLPCLLCGPSKSPFDIVQQQKDIRSLVNPVPPIQIQINQPELEEGELIEERSENQSVPPVVVPLVRDDKTSLEGEQSVPSESNDSEEVFVQMGKFKRGRGRGRKSGCNPRKWISVLRRSSRKGQPEPAYVFGGDDLRPSSTSGGETIDTTDDSIILMSPADSPGSSRSIGGLDSGGGHYKSTAKQGPSRLFNSSATSTATSKSARSSNDTIDLVDDDDDDDDPVYHPAGYLPNPQHRKRKSSLNDIIVLSDEDSKSDLQESTISTTSASTPIADTRTEDDCEIIAVKLVPRKQSLSPGRRANRRNSPGNISFLASRRTSLSFNAVKLSVERARKHMSSVNLAKPSVMSHGIRKKQKKGKGGQTPNVNKRYNTRPRPQFEFVTPVSMRKNYSKARPQRRATSPVYLLDKELGPVTNINFGTQFSQLPSTSWGFTAPTFIPVGGSKPSSFALQIRRPAKPVIPAEPNFLSVSTNENRVPGSLRPIVIDGSNVAMGHKGNRIFSCRGIQLCVEFFKRRGHEVVACVPQFRRKPSESVDTDILETMEKEGTVKFTPSREVGGHRISSYDDRFIVQYAHIKDAVIVSNDQFKDLHDEEPEWRDTLKFRLLQFTWMDEDCIMFARDPMGRNGPDLEQFLRF